MKLINIPDGQLALYRDGKGDPIVCLHGGPGDTHHYMRRMSKPLWQSFSLVNYDQRGSGKSLLSNIDETTLSLQHFFDDLLLIRKEYALEKLTLLGHSWGAVLALFFNMKYPELVKKAALVSMGPLNSEYEENCSFRLLESFSEEEKKRWLELRSKRNEALAREDHLKVSSLDKELMEIRVKGWVFDPEKRSAYLEEYFQDPPPRRDVNKLVWKSSRGFYSREGLKKINNPLWICYGENDVSPIKQADEIKGIVKSSTVQIIKDCGHIPWFEKKEEFYSGLSSFLKS